jgi:hypothetical protein
VFEVLFEGNGIYPEAIPLGALTQTLSAIRRLAAGAELPDEDEEFDAPDDGSIRLLEVVRGSAVFRFVGPAAATAVAHLRGAGKVLDNPEELGDNDYVLNPIERLSATARRLACSIVVREPGSDKAVLARIGPTSYQQISERLFVTGDTAFSGRVERVGGATEMRCGLRVPFQTRMLFCTVASPEVARQLGEYLYRPVSVQGRARWIKNNWRVVHFTVTSVSPLSDGSLGEAFRALREAGGMGWDEISDPRSYLEEVSGQ